MSDGLPPQPSHHIAAPTYLQYATHYDEPIMDVGGPDIMTMLPGSSLVPNQAGWMSGSFYAAPEYTSAPPLLVQHHAPPPLVAVTPAYMPATSVVPQAPTMEPQTSSHQASFQSMTRSILNNSGMFRTSQSMYANQMQIADATSHNLALTTAQFKK